MAFGIAHPELFALMSRDVRPGEASAATLAGLQVLRQRIRRVAAAGRLRVSEDRAVVLMQSVCVGIVQTLLAQPETQPDLGLSKLGREAVIHAICGEPDVPASSGVQGAAIALRASLDATCVLTLGERHLLEELLDRIAASSER